MVSVCVEVVEKTADDNPQLEVATVAYMMILGASANDFVDGMSIGAAFAYSFSRGISLGVAVIAQHLPQEIGPNISQKTLAFHLEDPDFPTFFQKKLVFFTKAFDSFVVTVSMMRHW